jgi:hypothetical protein
MRLMPDAVLQQDIPLPRRMASCVIGLKGKTVGQLRRDSNAKIHIRPGVLREELDQVVEIEGPFSSVRVMWGSACSAPLWHRGLFGGCEALTASRLQAGCARHLAQHPVCVLAMP